MTDKVIMKNLIEVIENDETLMKKYLKCQGEDISDADENFLKKYVLSVNQMIDCIEKNYNKCIDDTTNHKIHALKIFKSHVEKVSKSKKLIKQKLRQFDDDDQSNHSAHNRSVNSTYSSNSTNHSNTLNNSVELNSIQDNINNPMDISEIEIETDKILGFSPDDLIQSLENATNQTQQKLTQIVGTDKSTKAKKILSHLIKTLTASKEIFEESLNKVETSEKNNSKKRKATESLMSISKKSNTEEELYYITKDEKILKIIEDHKEEIILRIAANDSNYSNSSQEIEDLKQMQRNIEVIHNIMKKNRKYKVGATYPNMGEYEDIVDARKKLSSGKTLDKKLVKYVIKPEDLEFIEVSSCERSLKDKECPKFQSKVERNDKKIQVLYKTMFTKSRIYIQIVFLAIRPDKQTEQWANDLYKELLPLSEYGKTSRYTKCTGLPHTVMSGCKIHERIRCVLLQSKKIYLVLMVKK